MGENEVEVVETQEEPKSGEIYARQTESFLKEAGEDLDKAIDRFGFTMWHSLPDKEQVTLKEKLGIGEISAADLHCRGTACALEEDFEAAEADLKAALKKDADYAPAALNLAVCLEKTERPDEARKMYEKYVKILRRARGRRDLRLGSDEEIENEAARINQHLETLG